MNAIEDRQEAKEFSKDVKARRGWWFSVMFLLLDRWPDLVPDLCQDC